MQNLTAAAKHWKTEKQLTFPLSKAADRYWDIQKSAAVQVIFEMPASKTGGRWERYGRLWKLPRSVVTYKYEEMHQTANAPLLAKTVTQNGHCSSYVWVQIWEINGARAASATTSTALGMQQPSRSKSRLGKH